MEVARRTVLDDDLGWEFSPPAWHAEAACQGWDTNLFFQETRGPANYRTVKALCLTCPVTEQCLAAGLHEEFGVWGGLTPNERRKMRRLHRGVSSPRP